MYCRKCGKQIDDSAKFCTFCGEPTGATPVLRAPVQQQEKDPFQTWKLVSGIITLVFAGIIGLLTGCASILGDLAGHTDEAINTKFSSSAIAIVCGIVSIATRKRTDNKGNIAIIVFGVWSGLMALDPISSDTLQAVWMLICAAVAGFAIYYTKKHTLV